jgi:hypothetical protein
MATKGFWPRFTLGFVILVLNISLAWAEASDGALYQREILVEYLYLDANEDQASGGHAALRINDDVFHFQYNNGLLTMARDPWADFQLSYRGYQNRNISSTRLDISRGSFELIRASFVRRHLTQSRQIELLQDTDRDLALLSSLQAMPAASLELPGFGFFEPPVVIDEGGRRESLLAAIVASHGDNFLSQREQVLQRQLSELPVTAIAISAEDFVAGSLPQPDYAFNQRYADIVAGLLAIDILRSDAGLSDRALELSRTVPADLSLLPLERDALLRSADALQQRLVDLVASRRPDWGRATLLGLARLEAMRMSLAQDRWVFIDVLASDASIVDIGTRTRDLLPELRADSREVWLRARHDWVQQSSWHEHSYAQLEAANANWLELGRLAAGASDWRIHTARQVPRGLGELKQPLVPKAVAAHGIELKQQMQQSQQLAEAYARDNIGYKLISRNCVSELFDTIDIALVDGLSQRGEALSEQSLEQETRLRLGDGFDPSPIPFVSSRQVRQHWRSSDEQELLSLRRLYTKSQAQGSAALKSLWRESNTLTSTVYQRSDQDSFFIFFTDGKVWLRPAQGLVNLTAALGASVVGTVQWPFDGGVNLKAGLRGALFSLPELGFQNIRKGSNTWIPPQLRNVQLE